MSTTETLLTPKEVATKLGISETTLKRWRLDHQGPPAVHLSAQVIRYRPEAVEQWIEDNQPTKLEE